LTENVVDSAIYDARPPSLWQTGRLQWYQ